jgi:hypothetical protein
MISKLMAAAVHPATKEKIGDASMHAFFTILAVGISGAILKQWLEGASAPVWLEYFGLNSASWLTDWRQWSFVLLGTIFITALSGVIFVVCLCVGFFFTRRLILSCLPQVFLAVVYIVALPFWIPYLLMSLLTMVMGLVIFLPTKVLMTAFGMSDYEALKIVLASAIVWPTLWLISKLHRRHRR